MQRGSAPATLEGPAHSFTVDRHHTRKRLGKTGHELPEPSLERLRIERLEHTAKRIVAWDAVLQPQKLPQERLLGLPKLGHISTGLGTTQQRRQRNENYFQKIVSRVGCARIGQIRKAGAEFFHRVLPP